MNPLIVVAAVAVLVAYQAFRRPMLRRLALRDALRRPAETALVVAGSLLGTALITGSFIVGDTLHASVRSTAYTQLGPIDESVRLPLPLIADSIARELTKSDDPSIDGVLRVDRLGAAFLSESSGKRKAEPRGQLLATDFEDARSFGAAPTTTGISGDTPTGREAAITVDLARTLRVSEGDRVRVFAYGERYDLTVARVLPRRGVAGYWVGEAAESANAFVSPGLFEKVARRADPELAPPSFEVLVSNRGNVEGGSALTKEVSKAIEAAAKHHLVRVDDLKETRLERAEAEGDAFGEIFLGIGAFAIIAGILLLVNIFVMLAEERKSQLGMLRAVGMRRAHLIRTFVLEGFGYSLAASLLGAAVGIGVGWAIVQVVARILSGIGPFSLDLTLAIESESIVYGFCIGFLISLTTIVLTSIRISRVNIIRAIRDLPEPHSYRPRTRSVIVGGLVAAAAGAWFAVSLGDRNAWAAALAGPPLVLFGLLPLASRFAPRRWTVMVVAAFALLWGIFGNSLLDGRFFQAGEIFAFVLQGVLLTFSAVILVSQMQETFEAGIRRIAARRIPLRLSIAYPLARRVRTGLTLGMFSLVMFTMSFISILANVFGGQVATATEKEGSFQILAEANFSNPPAEGRLERTPGVEGVATLLHGSALFTGGGVAEPRGWTASGIDRSFIEGGPPKLSEKLKGLSERETWERLLDDNSATIIPAFFLQDEASTGGEFFEVGSGITVTDPLTGTESVRRIIGLVENDYAFSGAYMSMSSLREVLGQRAAPARYYVQASGSYADQAKLAEELEARFVANGLEARTFRDVVESFQRVQMQFLRLMQGYLALGLIVGIAGLGVVMVRAVRERRRDVGVLRSLGLLVGEVRRAFVFESGFVALEGILLGVSLATVTASQLIGSGEFGEDIDFVLPWAQLGIVTVSTLIASLLATAWPAQQASQIPPAVALRIAE